VAVSTAAAAETSKRIAMPSRETYKNLLRRVTTTLTNEEERVEKKG
jgi:hypothetical protein